MPVTYYRGDLFADPSIKYFAHGCNCRGAMGKGIAVQFKKRWIAMYAAYKKSCTGNLYEPGDVFMWRDRDCVIFNLMTQRDWKGNDRATIPAIEKCVTDMLQQAQMKNIPYIAMPMIGAGLGGLEWNDVRAVLERLAENSSVELRVVTEYRKGKALEKLSL